MKIGFTGTRKGMSEGQRQLLGEALYGLHGGGHVLIHGAAVGADTEAAEIAQRLGFSLDPHPAGADPLVRNRAIVSECDFLIAAPASDREQLRSGTWATVRYARKAGKPIVMLPR